MAANQRLLRPMELMTTSVDAACRVNSKRCPSGGPSASRVAEVPSALAVVAAAVVAVAAAGADQTAAVEVAGKLSAGTVAAVAAVVAATAAVSHVSVLPDEDESLELRVVPQVVWDILELDAQEVLEAGSPVSGLLCYILLNLGESGIQGSCGLVQLALLLLCGLALDLHWRLETCTGDILLMKVQSVGGCQRQTCPLHCWNCLPVVVVEEAALEVMLVLLALVKALVLVKILAASWEMAPSLVTFLEQWCQVLVAGRSSAWLLGWPECAVWQAGWQQLHWLLRYPILQPHHPPQTHGWCKARWTLVPGLTQA